MTDNIYSSSDNDLSPLNREEFCNSVSAYHRYVGWCVVALVLAFFLLFWLLGVATSAMNDAHVPEESFWRYLPIGMLVLGSLTIVWVFGWFAQNSQLKCPHCSHPLLRANCAIVTGRCPSCAKFLFEKEKLASKEASQAPVETLLSQEELLADLENARHVALRPTLIWAISGIILVVLGSLSGRWLSDELASQLGDVWTPFVVPALLAPGIIVASWSLAVWSRHFRTSRPCPHCGAPILASDFASITGNCSTCGHKAVSDPCPGIEPWDDHKTKPRWLTREFQRLAKPRHDRLWIGCLVGGAIAALWMFLLIPLFSSDSKIQISLNSLWGATVFILGVGGMLLFQCAGVMLWHWYSARHLRCPKCHSELLHFYRLVVSSKHCYHCGATVIHERRVPE